jgi:hypothetical protein
VTLLAVEISQLFEVIWVSVLAGIAITTSYSLVVFGTGRMAAAQREGRRGEAFAYAALAVICFIVFLGGVIYGAKVMLTK